MSDKVRHEAVEGVKKHRPEVNDYYDGAFDGAHLGVMTRYKSFNLSTPAYGLMELLETLYAFHDDHYNKTQKGLINKHKLVGPSLDEIVYPRGRAKGQPRYIEDIGRDDDDFWGDVLLGEGKLEELFDAVECQYNLVDYYVQNPFKKFRKPKQPCLTRTGFIKFTIITYIDRMEKGDDTSYLMLVRLKEKYNLQVPDTTRSVMLLDDRWRVDESFKTLARELLIPIEKLIGKLNAFKATLPTFINNKRTLKYAQKPRSTYDASASGDTEYQSISPPASIAPPPQLPTWKPKPLPKDPFITSLSSHANHKPEHRKTVEQIQEEKEALELKRAQREYDELKEKYDRELKDLKRNNEIEYIQAQTRNLDAVSKSMEASAERMRRIGLEEYYPEYWYR